MKSKIIFTIVFLITFSHSFSQNKKDNNNILKYSTELNLTNEQIEQIKKEVFIYKLAKNSKRLLDRWSFDPLWDVCHVAGCDKTKPLG